MVNPDDEPNKISAQAIIDHALELIKDAYAPHNKSSACWPKR